MFVSQWVLNKNERTSELPDESWSESLACFKLYNSWCRHNCSSPQSHNSCAYFYDNSDTCSTYFSFFFFLFFFWFAWSRSTHCKLGGMSKMFATVAVPAIFMRLTISRVSKYVCNSIVVVFFLCAVFYSFFLFCSVLFLNFFVKRRKKKTVSLFLSLVNLNT